MATSLLPRIELWFSAEFEPWGVTLPAEDMRERRPGHLFAQGWHIGYIWGAEDGDEYAEVLCQHRMTDDRHVRIYGSGRIERLDTAYQGYSYPAGASSEDIERAKREYVRHNREINAELRAKGLLPPVGANLPALDINEYLRSGGDDEPLA